MSAPRLSICIPTYNFGKFIGETLRSIVPQLTERVEIVVLDGASTDNTAEVVREAQLTCAAIRYERLAARGGIDRDMARSVELAAGDYCWLFSSDDVMRPGALAQVLAEIDSGSDVYLCKHALCTVDMRAFGVREVLAVAQRQTFELADPEVRRRYCELARSTEAFFSFMSGLVVKRSRWLSVPLNEKFVGSCWAHVARLLELIRDGLSVGWIPRVLLDQRGDNDSFADRGVVNRFQIAIEGYHRLADEFFGHDSIEAFHVRRVVRTEFCFRVFLATRVRLRRQNDQNSRDGQGGPQDLAALDQLIRRTFVDVPLTGWLVRVGCKVFPRRAYPALQGLYHRAVARYRRRRHASDAAS